MDHRRPLRGLAIALLLFGGCFGLFSLDWRPRLVPEVGPVIGEPIPVAADDGLLVGAAEIDLTPDEPMPLGGFGARRGRAFESVRDPVSVRALALSDGIGGGTVVLLNIDTVLVPDPLSAAIRDSMRGRGLDVAGVVVTATHTHAGIGGTWDNPLAGLLGMGRYDAGFAGFVVEAAVEAAEEAMSRLAPAETFVSTGRGPSICTAHHEERSADRRLTVVRFEGEDGPLARLVVFACHPTFLGHRDARLSAEWPGEAARRLEGTSLFLQGTVGDQRPTGFRLRDLGISEEPDLDVSGPEGRMVAAGRAVAKAVGRLEAARASGAGDETGHLALHTTEVKLPAATGETVAPPGLRRIAGNVLARAAPRSARLSLLRIGDVRLIFVPAEVVSEVAHRWEGESGARIVSLADGYVGYLETPEAIDGRSAESRHAFFDHAAFEVIGEGIERLLAASFE